MTTQLSPIQMSEIRERTLKEVAKLPRAIGRYEIRGELGHGGMGIVYDAYDPSLERRVAVKVIHRDKLGDVADRADIAERFEKEMRSTSDIFHPNIVAILDAGVEEMAEGPQPYYVMERIDGDSLEQVLQKSGTVSRRNALQIAESVARGLDAAHAKGLVHRDLKPSNILLPDDGVPRIADFGLCRFRNELSSLTDAGTILGSANYIAPEQLRSEEVTGAADLFALGAILVRVLTGSEPFPADSIAAHLQRILTEDPDGLELLQPDVRALVGELMSKDPARRPASALEVADRLHAMAEGSGGAVPISGVGARRGEGSGSADQTSDAAPPTASRSANRLRWVAAIAALFVVAGCVTARNQLVKLDTLAQTQWKQVENALARQNELIPQLVQVTKKYTEYEQETLGLVLDSRRAYLAGQAQDRPEAAASMERAVADLVRVADRYPNLKADAHYRALAYEIAGSKNRIAVERMRYNESVGALNARLNQFPWGWFAGSLAERSFFDPTPAQMAEPALDL